MLWPKENQDNGFSVSNAFASNHFPINTGKGTLSIDQMRGVWWFVSSCLRCHSQMVEREYPEDVLMKGRKPTLLEK